MAKFFGKFSIEVTVFLLILLIYIYLKKHVGQIKQLSLNKSITHFSQIEWPQLINSLGQRSKLL